jgi:lipopolysaccharide transport system ATP-binding protein
MYVRLAFAVSAHLSPDILLLDEVLAVGDLAFQRKCLEHAKELRSRKGIVVLVSHNMFAIKAVCNRVIYLFRGQIAYDGAPDSAIQQFEADSRLETPGWAQGRLGREASQRAISFTDIELLDEAGNRKTVFDHGERIRVRLHYTVAEPLQQPNINVSFIRSDNVGCCNFNTVMDGFETGDLQGDGTIELLTPPLKLVSELYTVHVLVWDTQFKSLYNVQVGGSFHVRHPVLSSHFGVFHEAAEWSLPGNGACLAPRRGTTSR